MEDKWGRLLKETKTEKLGHTVFDWWGNSKRARKAKRKGESQTGHSTFQWCLVGLGNE